MGEYVAAVALQGAPAIQLQECRRAFYAGVHAMQSCMMDVSGSGVNEDDGAAYFEARRQELIAFYERVKAGTA